MKKFIVNAGSRDELNYLKDLDISGIIVSLEGLSASYNFTVSLDEIDDIIRMYQDKMVIISMNKIMYDKDLALIERTLRVLKEKKVLIMFYDMGVFNIAIRLGMSEMLIISQEHLNASTISNRFYQKRGINYSYITSDITYNEVSEIKDSGMKILYNIYGHIPMFYSRRSLISNYLKYINKRKNGNLYYMKHNDDFYPIKEESEGTCIYSKCIDLTSEISKMDDDIYLVINLFDTHNYKDIMKKIISMKKTDDDKYLGFYETGSMYKVKKGDL